jgi:small subunit ribosomal protein S5
MAQRKNQTQNAIPELEERVVSIKRVSKTVKGGRRMQLSALVVVGDGKGKVGIGMGKSQEVPQAIKKGVEDAKKNMFRVPITESGTLPHDIMGVYGAGRVLIRPAVQGTGVMAGGPVRAVMELAGVKNVITKCLGTNNALNIVKATAEGLKLMESPEDVARRRGISVSQIFGTNQKAKASETEKVEAAPVAETVEVAEPQSEEVVETVEESAKGDGE